MGYRSDIRITTSKEGFKVLSEFAKKYLENKNKCLKRTKEKQKEGGDADGLQGKNHGTDQKD